MGELPLEDQSRDKANGDEAPAISKPRACLWQGEFCKAKNFSFLWLKHFMEQMKIWWLYLWDSRP